MITIENKKTYRGEGIYIGRPSLLGNPYAIGKDGTRQEVIERYRTWLWRQIKLQGEVYRELQRLAAKAQEGDLIPAILNTKSNKCCKLGECQRVTPNFNNR